MRRDTREVWRAWLDGLGEAGAWAALAGAWAVIAAQTIILILWWRR